MYEVPCNVNGLPLNFIFDTGASTVSISSIEVSFMLKNVVFAKVSIKDNKADFSKTEECISRFGDISITNLFVFDNTKDIKTRQ